MTIKYPTEFPRTQRSINEINHYKANEYKIFLFYWAYFSLKSLLPEIYFKHLTAYILFIRILTQKNLEPNDFRDAYVLINYFISKFSELYGEDKLNYKLHAHMHLISQCNRVGPLTQISSFPFEGLFKECRKYIHGTTGYLSQIHNNVHNNRFIDFEMDKLINEIQCFQMKSFIISTLHNKKKYYSEKIIRVVSTVHLEEDEKIYFGTRTESERLFLLKKVNLNFIGI